MPQINLEPDSCIEYICYEVDEYTPMVTTDLPDYTGETSVTPSTQAQTLATANKAVHGNITIAAIPYTETANEYGTTVTIGA